MRGFEVFLGLPVGPRVPREPPSGPSEPSRVQGLPIVSIVVPFLGYLIGSSI